MAAAASMQGTALGTMQGSCLPRTVSFALSIVLKSTVSCSAAIDGVGLIAALNTMGIPVVIPPSMPPQLFVFVMILPFSTAKGSLF